MSTLIVGAGAVGGYFAAQLASAGKDVTVLARGARAESLRRDGLRLARVDGSAETVPVKVLTAHELQDPAAVVIVAVKASGLPSALEDIAGAVGPSTVILPLLNGVEHLQILQDRYPGQILGGVCIVATDLEQDGIIRQLSPGASITYGELDGTDSPRLRQVAGELADAGFDSAVSSEILQEMWEKWLFMAVGGAATVLLGGSAGSITAAPGGAEVIEAIIDELTAVTTRAGHAPRPQALARIRGALLTAGSPFTTSLYRDVSQGRPSEGETILGDLDRLASREDVPHPLLTAAIVRIRVNELGR